MIVSSRSPKFSGIYNWLMHFVEHLVCVSVVSDNGDNAGAAAAYSTPPTLSPSCSMNLRLYRICALATSTAACMLRRRQDGEGGVMAREAAVGGP